MNTSFTRNDPGLGVVLSFSTILHLLLYALLTFTHFSLNPIKPEQVYYVDMVNLPVASPRAGNPAAAEKGESLPAPLPAEQHEMKAPTPAAKAPAAKRPAAVAVPGKKGAAPAAESASEFEERIARLERDADERRQAAAFDLLRKKVFSRTAGQAGMPAGTGKEAGSDYASYIQSRLYEAFKLPKGLQSKNQEVLVHLNINRAGRLAEYRIERTSGDKAFEDAVARAIANAERMFRPPPNNQNFEQNFVFRPNSVGKK